MAAPSEVRKRKMVPRVTPPPTPELGMDNEFVDLEIGGEGATTPGSPPKPANNNLQPNHAKKNGSGPKRWTTDFQHYKETSLTEPLLAGESETASDEEVNTLIERDTSEPDHVSEFIVNTDNEASWQIALQVFLPYIVAGLGMVGAGLVLDKVQHWVVFKEVSEIFILVPALLGLKGNLEMTLASRLSTQANLGNMDSSKEQWKMIGGNLALTQAQAIVVGFLASIVAMVFGWIPKGKFVLSHAFLLSASSVLTAAIASFILGSIMIVVVVLSRKFRINPDNVATPIAASLGDLTTLALLSSISALLWNAIESHPWLAVVLLVIFLGLMPLWCFISHKNKYTYDVLYSGWVPIIGAMGISSVGGLILDATVAAYDGIAVFQPVINGVGGNLVAVQASRLSTSLHMASTPGKLPKNAVDGCPNPITTFFGKDIKARTARVLMLMVIPGQIIFLAVIHMSDGGHTSLTPVFIIGYLTAAVIQVGLLLYIANWMVHFLWKKGDDPDNFSIPYLTAIGDLLGTGLLALTFHILYVIGDKDEDVGD